MLISFFSDIINLVIIILIISCLILPTILVKLKKDNYSLGLFFFYPIAIFLAYSLYKGNVVNDLGVKTDMLIMSDVSININTFKKHEHRIPREQDFYLSGFLNESRYFYIENGEKIFNPLRPVNFKVSDNEGTLSFSYTREYNKKSFLKTGQAYRYCLNMPEALHEYGQGSFKNAKFFVNDKELDYKKATVESMKKICHYTQPNNYTITFF